MKTPIRFKNFSFNHAAGELLQRDESGRESITRLPPQPANLLLLLLKKYPAMVSREEIKASIWPDVHVDFERSLHYCIRQIRAALHEDASDPRFIETIPRRGYRWIAAIEPDDALPVATHRPSVYSRKFLLLGLLVIASLLTYTFLSGRKTDAHSAPDAPLRVAVMPFQPTETSNEFHGNDLALQLVATLTNKYKNTYQIIGPTTTANYPPDKIRQLIQDLQIDCVINGRFSQVKDTSRLLAEIIRANDGAHVWVKYFDPATSGDTIVGMITTGLLQQFGPVVQE